MTNHPVAHVAAGRPPRLTRRGVNGPLLASRRGATTLTRRGANSPRVFRVEATNRMGGLRHEHTLWSELGPKSHLRLRIVPICRDYVVRMRGLEPHRSPLTNCAVKRHPWTGCDRKPCSRWDSQTSATPSLDRVRHRRTNAAGPDLVRIWSEQGDERTKSVRGDNR